jgi:hypothetical protein
MNSRVQNCTVLYTETERKQLSSLQCPELMMIQCHAPVPKNDRSSLAEQPSAVQPELLLPVRNYPRPAGLDFSWRVLIGSGVAARRPATGKAHPR